MRASLPMLPGRLTPIRPRRLTASSSTSMAMLVSTSGTAALAHRRPGYFFCAPAISSFHSGAASRPSSTGRSEKTPRTGRSSRPHRSGGRGRPCARAACRDRTTRSRNSGARRRLDGGIVVAAFLLTWAGETLALAQPLQDRPRPPVEMRIDDVHRALLPNGWYFNDFSNGGVPGQHKAPSCRMATRGGAGQQLASARCRQERTFANVAAPPLRTLSRMIHCFKNRHDLAMTRREFKILRSGIAGVEAVELNTRHVFPRHTHEQFGIGVIQRGAQKIAQRPRHGGIPFKTETAQSAFLPLSCAEDGKRSTLPPERR